jgi:hypothetical protein
VWIAIDDRYLLPILPLIGLLFFMGLYKSLQRLGVRSPIPFAILGILLLAGQLDVGMRQAYWIYRQPEVRRRRAPDAALRWISDHIPAKDIVVTNKAELLYLRTGRQAADVGDDWEGIGDSILYQRLRESHATYVILMRERLLIPARAHLWAHMEKWMMDSPSRFEHLYSNSKERVEIFRIQEPQT